MTIKEIIRSVDGQLVCGDSLLDEEQQFACASDLMSDVLTLKHTNFVLITGLANVQSIRTAEMSDVKCIVLVRGKVPTEDMLELARDNDMALICSRFSMFKASGVLFQAGLTPVY